MILEKLKQLYESGLCIEPEREKLISRFGNYTLACVRGYHGISDVCLFDTGGEKEFSKVYPMLPTADKIISDFIFGRHYSYDFFLVEPEYIHYDIRSQLLRIPISGQINKIISRYNNGTSWICLKNAITVSIGKQSRFYLTRICK